MFNVTHSSIKAEYDCIGLELVQAATGQTIYFEFLAYSTVAKGVRAYLMSTEHRVASNIRWMQDLVIFFGEEARLWSPPPQRLKCGLDHVVIADQGIGAGGTSAEIYLIGRGTEMPPSFGARIKQNLPLGILPEWIEPLWLMLTSPEGQRKYKLLHKLNSLGDLEIWQITDLTLPRWRTVLWDLLQIHPWHPPEVQRV